MAKHIRMRKLNLEIRRKVLIVVKEKERKISPNRSAIIMKTSETFLVNALSIRRHRLSLNLFNYAVSNHVLMAHTLPAWVIGTGVTKHVRMGRVGL